MFLCGCSSNSDFEIFESFRHHDDDYDDECRYHSDFDKEIVLTTHLTPDVDLDPNFTFSRAPASSKEGVQDPLTGVTRRVRNSYHLQVLVWNLCLPQGDDHSAVANHICEPWHIICLQGGVGFANHATLHHRFHVVIVHHCALLLNKDTFERDVTTKSIMVPCKKMSQRSSWGHSRERPIQEACWRWLPPLFFPERPHQSCVWCPSFHLCQFDVVATAAGAPKKDGRHSLATLTRTPREGSWANPLPCRLLSVQLQCRAVRLATGVSRARRHDVGRMLWHCQTTAHQMRVAHSEDGSHGCGCQEDGPILPLWPVGTHAARSL